MAKIPDYGFNWQYAVYLIICSLLSVFFLLYFNRLFGSVVSYGIRTWTWHRYRIHIEIQAIQISLLAGRVFFKGVKYHGRNETILIHSGYATWCYWLRNVREVNIREKREVSVDQSSLSSDSHAPSAHGAELGGATPATKLPCRVRVVVRGAEWFVYNRSPAYDAVLSGLTSTTSSANEPSEGHKLRRRRKDDEKLSSDSESRERRSKVEKSFESARTKDSASSTTRSEEHQGVRLEELEESLYLRFLPAYLECSKAALVMGNENTKSVLIAKFDRVSGEVGASSSGPLDHYRQLFSFNFEHPVISMQPNDDYKEDQASAINQLKNGVTTEVVVGTHGMHSWVHRLRRRAWHQLQDLVPYFRSSVDSLSTGAGEKIIAAVGRSSAHWHGLSRYLDEEEQDDRARWAQIEYAAVPTIIDSKSASMIFYWDVPGTVPYHSPTRPGDINGDDPPGYGVDLTLKGATINYGPWADRHRADLQKAFFPFLCKDNVPATKLRPGDTRVATIFKFYLQIDEEVTLRVPVKEDSKNWKWKKHADTMWQDDAAVRGRSGKARRKRARTNKPLSETRAYGWFEVKVAENTTVSYSMDMVAGEHGFRNQLELDLPAAEISTSVNHGLLWRSVNQKVVCDLSNPLQWNGLHTWRFDLMNEDLELYILREHVILLIDMIDDFSNGPPPEFLTFSPFRYLVNLQFKDFKLLLNVNDSNIINSPTDFDDNAFLIIHGSSLKSGVCIPIDKFRPSNNTVTFDVELNDGGIDIHVPPWNTQATLLASKDVAKLKGLLIDGKYHYCATTSTSNTDTLQMDLHGLRPSVELYGFLIRYFIIIKENYFGENIHFKTLEEYQNFLAAKQNDPDADPTDGQPSKKSNDLDVILNVAVDDSTIILPSNLYQAKNHVRIDVPFLGLDLRVTNYYMDLDVSFSTLASSLCTEDEGIMSSTSMTSATQLFIDGLKIYGHRLFGLPPDEPTYMCNWDFAVGNIRGECSVDFLKHFITAAKGIGFSFDDDENALPLINLVPLHDITFLRATIEPIRIWLHVDEQALLLSTDSIKLVFNDWAGSHYSKKAALEIPNIMIACVDAESASRHRLRSDQAVETHAVLQTSVSVTVIIRKAGSAADRERQQDHVWRHDQRTNRAEFLLLGDVDAMAGTADIVNPPAMAVPLVPWPLSEATTTSSSSAASLKRPPRRIKRQQSFLSTASVSSASTANSRRSVVRSKSGSYLRQTPPVTGTGHPKKDRLSKQSYDLNREGSVASTGRQSSFYSLPGDVDERRHFPAPGAVSSTYAAPYFPLQFVEPCIKDVPEWETSAGTKRPATPFDITLDDINPDHFDEHETVTSFIVEFNPGIRMFMDPDAVHCVVHLINGLCPTDPRDILDSLQMDVMTQIFDRNKKRNIARRSTQLQLQVPELHLRLINSSVRALTDSQCETDQYDLSLHRLTITSKSLVIRNNSPMPPDFSEQSLLQVLLDDMELSAKERLDGMDQPHAAINARVKEFIFWMRSGDTVSIRAKLKAIEAATSSSEIEYLASLLHRTTMLAKEFGATFDAQKEEKCRRLRLLVYLISTYWPTLTDPQFLFRPSSVLRSAQGHLRLEDSWKFVGRLRQLYESLRIDDKQDVLLAISAGTETPPENASSLVIGIFNQWREWYQDDIASSLAMQYVFGENKPSDRMPPIHIVASTHLAKLILDPGPKQNEVLVSALSANVVMEEGQDSSMVPKPIMKTSVQVYCIDAGISLNWELCELVNDVLQLAQQAEPKPKTQRLSQIGKSPAHPVIENQLHVVVVAETGSITLDTINARCISITKALKTSFVMIDGRHDHDVLAYFTVAAEAGTSNVRSHAQEVLQTQLRGPSIYVSFESTVRGAQREQAIKAGAYCQELKYDVQQDPIALLEIANRFIGDEVAQIYALQQRIPKKGPTTAAVNQPNENPLQIDVALFLDSYSFSIPLLQSLKYSMSGNIARGSISASTGAGLTLDFDFKQHYHNMQTRLAGEQRSISVLRMPPTNGKVSLQSTPSEHIVSCFVSTELVKLEAGAIHSLMTALNRPEISNVVDELKKEIESLADHLEQVFGRRDQPKAPSVQSTNSKQLVYDANITFQGLEVAADAPGSKDGNDKASLEFKLGSLQIKAANRIDPHGPVLVYPEIHVGLRHIVFELSRSTSNGLEPCGNFTFAAFLTATSKKTDAGDDIRAYHFLTDSLEINLFAETASTMISVIGYFQQAIKDVDLSWERQYLKKLSKPTPRRAISHETNRPESVSGNATAFFASQYTLEMRQIQVSWVIASWDPDRKGREDLVLSFKRINFSTRKENAARLTLEDLQLQMVPLYQSKTRRALNSALLPEVIFNVGFITTKDARRLVFQAAGKSLDLRLTSQFIIPAAHIKNSIVSATDKLRAAMETWNTKRAAEETLQVQSPATQTQPRQLLFGRKRMESLFVDADFAGATVYLSGKKLDTKQPRLQSGKYAQFTQNDSNTTALESPGLAFKVEYRDNGLDEPSVNAEFKIDPSSNTLYPTVVSLLLEMSSSVKEIVNDEDNLQEPEPKATAEKVQTEDNFLTADPSTVIGRVRLNFGLRILRQKFTLSCHPIARVAASAQFDDIYVTVNTVRSLEHGHFFALSAVFNRFETSVQHVYSRESTGSFKVDSVVLSLMNSKHVSGVSGLSAILNVSPMQVLVNAKQLQDFLLFREIWVPPEARQTETVVPDPQQSQILVQRYQEVAATGAFPWNATVFIAEVDVQVDLGQAIGRSRFQISKFWVSSKKNSNWEQNLCLGFDKIGIESTGRTSGSLELQEFEVRTSIEWPSRETAINHTPLVQASVAFKQLRVKGSFDYQPFLVADIRSFSFMMYNVHSSPGAHGDRLFAILEGDAVDMFCTTTTASQALALYQALQKLVQENKTNYELSLREIERYIKRATISPSSPQPTTPLSSPSPEDRPPKSPVSLFTRVVVSLKAVNMGCFPSTFFDHQVFKIEALNAQARFSVALDRGQIHSGLGLTLGQLRVALSSVREPSVPKTSGEISVDDVVKSATGSRGGIILRVPKLEATMQTWQVPESHHIDYIFKSSFEGKVEVGWNYSRISYIRSMWASHSKSLALRLGKPLPPSAVKITGVPGEEEDKAEAGGGKKRDQKITAEVNVPQSKYDYTALEPPLIETPQLRDMGEATPPLEWIGLQRDRLPHLTHQIVIVSLLEVASEVEDAYDKILGSS